ncbi:unnamed protein product [Gordionus sp. m RMFG-2023]
MMIEARKTVVHFNDTKLDIIVQPRLYAGELLDIVCSHFNLKSKEYFGLCYVQDNDVNKTHWLQMDKYVLEHEFFENPCRNTSIENTNDDKHSNSTRFNNCGKRKYQEPLLRLHFKMKFYPDSVGSISDPRLLQLLFIQCKSSLSNNEILFCNTGQNCELLALSLQPYGDFQSYETSKSMLQFMYGASDIREILQTSLDEICRNHEKLIGMSRGEAIIKFMQDIQQSPTFGVHYYRVKDKHNLSYWLGISNNGITQSHLDSKLNILSTFHWQDLENLYYRDRKFSIEIHENKRSQNSGNPFSSSSSSNISVYNWYAETNNLARSIWALSVLQHQFYLEHQHSTQLIDTETANNVIAELNKNVYNYEINVPNGLKQPFPKNEKFTKSEEENSEMNFVKREKLLNKRDVLLAELEEKKALLCQLYDEETEILSLVTLTPDQTQEYSSSLLLSLCNEIVPRENSKYKFSNLLNPTPKATHFRDSDTKRSTIKETTFKIPLDFLSLTSSQLDDATKNHFNGSNLSGNERDTEIAVIGKLCRRIQELKMDREVQNKICSAALRLTREPSLNRNAKRARKVAYEKSFTKLKGIEERLDKLSSILALDKTLINADSNNLPNTHNPKLLTRKSDLSPNHNRIVNAALNYSTSLFSTLKRVGSKKSIPPSSPSSHKMKPDSRLVFNYENNKIAARRRPSLLVTKSLNDLVGHKQLYDSPYIPVNDNNDAPCFNGANQINYDYNLDISRTSLHPITTSKFINDPSWNPHNTHNIDHVATNESEMDNYLTISSYSRLASQSDNNSINSTDTISLNLSSSNECPSKAKKLLSTVSLPPYKPSRSSFYGPKNDERDRINQISYEDLELYAATSGGNRVLATKNINKIKIFSDINDMSDDGSINYDSYSSLRSHSFTTSLKLPESSVDFSSSLENSGRSKDANQKFCNDIDEIGNLIEDENLAALRWNRVENVLDHVKNTGICPLTEANFSSTNNNNFVHYDNDTYYDSCCTLDEWGAFQNTVHENGIQPILGGCLNGEIQCPQNDIDASRASDKFLCDSNSDPANYPHFSNSAKSGYFPSEVYNTKCSYRSKNYPTLAQDKEIEKISPLFSGAHSSDARNGNQDFQALGAICQTFTETIKPYEFSDFVRYSKSPNKSYANFRKNCDTSTPPLSPEYPFETNSNNVAYICKTKPVDNICLLFDAQDGKNTCNVVSTTAQHLAPTLFGSCVPIETNTIFRKNTMDGVKNKFDTVDSMHKKKLLLLKQSISKDSGIGGSLMDVPRGC